MELSNVQINVAYVSTDYGTTFQVNKYVEGNVFVVNDVFFSIGDSGKASTQ